MPTHDLPTLLSLDDPRYLRRLVREINAQNAGVYLSAAVSKTKSNPRLCGLARFSEAKQVICFPGTEGSAAPVLHKITAAQAAEAFCEGGRGLVIYASRRKTHPDLRTDGQKASL